MVLIAFTAKVAVIYTTNAAVRALLPQVNGEKPLPHPIKLTAKKHITAVLSAIERTFNGITDLPTELRPRATEIFYFLLSI